MCGITGFISKGSVDHAAAVVAMCDRIPHRGPDDSGAWSDPASGVTLGHRRLSILELSPLGHQPMTSASGRYVTVYNGEIYNFRELARELGHSYRFRGNSDTEVMLAAFEEWGIEKALQRFNGMFALAVWDCRAAKLYLARDRIGEKPLYYGWSGGAFLFGSELKALLANPDCRPQIDRNAVAIFMRHSFIPAPFSIKKTSFVR